VRPARFEEPSFMAQLQDAEKLIAERGGEIELEELQRRAEQLKPNDFFYTKPDAITLDVTPGERK
jgi:hypothetical protein